MQSDRRTDWREPRTDESEEFDPIAGRDPEFEALIRGMLVQLGEDPDREGLARTPQRVAASLAWLTRGYGLDVRDIINGAIFEETHANMVMVRDIELYSMCEHHLLPFFGKAHVAYIPKGNIIGLSKIPRIVEVFARRLQVQERLTSEIADTLYHGLKPVGVMVVVEAEHTCMTLRGVKKTGALTITSALRGGFRKDPRTRAEAMALIQGRS